MDAQTPAGFVVGPSSANGSLSVAEASRSTPLPTADVKTFLSNHHFRAGYARVWTSGKAFFVSTVLELRDGTDATAMLALVRSGFEQLAPAYIEPYPTIPDGLRYDFNVRKPSGIYQICTGVVFRVQSYVHLVSACDDNPPDGLLVRARAQAQYSRTLRLLHDRDSSTGPKAGTAMSSSSMRLQVGSAP
ncbi:MAG: hypothetical protein ABR549_18265 [Mycobacteriales bacterium]